MTVYASNLTPTVQPERVVVDVLPGGDGHQGNVAGNERQRHRHRHANSLGRSPSRPARLAAGVAQRARCTVYGARPNRPIVTWWKGGKQVRSPFTVYGHTSSWTK